MSDNFEHAIKERKKQNIKSEFTFIGMKETNLEKYEKIKNELFASVKFVSEVISFNADLKLVATARLSPSNWEWLIDAFQAKER